MSCEGFRPKAEYPRNLKEVRFGEERYLAPSWEEMGGICFNLAKSIIEEGRNFDRLVTLAKGGWTWSRVMADYLAIRNVASIQIIFYTDIGQTREEPIIIQSLPVDINGESILLFDDVVDSGKSFVVAQQYLTMCGARKITTATLFHKPWSKITPDFFGEETKAWVIFPHEIREGVRELNKKWDAQNIPENEIRKRCLQIGLDPTQVDYFLKLEAR